MMNEDERKRTNTERVSLCVLIHDAVCDWSAS